MVSWYVYLGNDCCTFHWLFDTCRRKVTTHVVIIYSPIGLYIRLLAYCAKTEA